MFVVRQLKSQLRIHEFQLQHPLISDTNYTHFSYDVHAFQLHVPIVPMISVTCSLSSVTGSINLSYECESFQLRCPIISVTSSNNFSYICM